MTTGCALDASTVRLVRKGCRVQLDGRRGIVTKANGPRAWVRWDEPCRPSTYEWCNRLEVL